MQVHHSLELKAYEDKVNSQLEQAKAKLQEVEAYYKGTKADAEIQTIHGLRTAHQNIERKGKELKTVAEAKVAQTKSEIDAALSNLNAKLEQLSKGIAHKVG
jgi:hypothetical protein